MSRTLPRSDSRNRGLRETGFLDEAGAGDGDAPGSATGGRLVAWTCAVVSVISPRGRPLPWYKASAVTPPWRTWLVKAAQPAAEAPSNDTSSGRAMPGSLFVPWPESTRVTFSPWRQRLRIPSCKEARNTGQGPELELATEVAILSRRMSYCQGDLPDDLARGRQLSSCRSSTAPVSLDTDDTIDDQQERSAVAGDGGGDVPGCADDMPDRPGAGAREQRERELGPRARHALLTSRKNSTRPSNMVPGGCWRRAVVLSAVAAPDLPW